MKKYILIILLSVTAFGQYGTPSYIKSGTEYSFIDTTKSVLFGTKDTTDQATSGLWYKGWNGSLQLGGSTGLYWDNANKRLGIGTTVPSAKLQVSATGEVASWGGFTFIPTLSSGSDANIIRASASDQSISRGLDFQIFDVSDGSTDAYINMRFGSADATGSILFGTSGSDRMIIDTTGNVGLGTTAPGYKLDVVGATNGLKVSSINRPTNNSGDINLLVLTTDGFGIDKGGMIGLGGKYNTAGNSWQFGQIAGRKEIADDGDSKGYLSFSTGNASGTFSEWMRITSTGNFGFGTTSPGTWKLNVNGDVYVEDTLSALVFVDRTPAYPDAKDSALAQVLRIKKTADNKIDHKTLPKFVYTQYNKPIWKDSSYVDSLGVLQTTKVVEQYEYTDGRNIGNMVTMLVDVVQKQQEIILGLEQRLKLLEKK